jgi:hypothetical protein
MTANGAGMSNWAFYVFSFDGYYPAGGFGDLDEVFCVLTDALQYAKKSEAENVEVIAILGTKWLEISTHEYSQWTYKTRLTQSGMRLVWRRRGMGYAIHL